MYFNVNFNVSFKLIKVHLLVSEFYSPRLFLSFSVSRESELLSFSHEVLSFRLYYMKLSKMLGKTTISFAFTFSAPSVRCDVILSTNSHLNTKCT